MKQEFMVCARCQPTFPGEHWQNCLHYDEEMRRCVFSTGSPRLFYIPGKHEPRWMTDRQAEWSNTILEHKWIHYFENHAHA